MHPEEKIHENVLQAIHLADIHIVLIVELNFPKINYSVNWTPLSQDSKEFKLVEITKYVFRTQLVNFPTRGHAAENPSTIDVIFASSESRVHRIDCESPLGKSDLSVLTFRYEAIQKPGHREKVGKYTRKATTKSVGKLYCRSNVAKSSMTCQSKGNGQN